MTNVEAIKGKGFFYRMGVLCGNMLYNTYKFDSFDAMIQEAERIDNKYKSDMARCRFCFQAFKDDTYNFEKACFSQVDISVNGISKNKERLAEIMLRNYERKEGATSAG